MLLDLALSTDRHGDAGVLRGVPQLNRQPVLPVAPVVAQQVGSGGNIGH